MVFVVTHFNGTGLNRQVPRQLQHLPWAGVSLAPVDLDDRRSLALVPGLTIPGVTVQECHIGAAAGTSGVTPVILVTRHHQVSPNFYLTFLHYSVTFVFLVFTLALSLSDVYFIVFFGAQYLRVPPPLPLILII